MSAGSCGSISTNGPSGAGVADPSQAPAATTCSTAGVSDHPADEHGLADAGLAGDKDHAAVPGGSFGEVAADRTQLRLALEQGH